MDNIRVRIAILVMLEWLLYSFGVSITREWLWMIGDMAASIYFFVWFIIFAFVALTSKFS